MDDSDQDFVDLYSKLLKRVRKKPGEPGQPRRAEHQPSSQPSDGVKRRRNNKRDCASKCAGTQPLCTDAEAEQHMVCGEAGYDSRDAGSSVGLEAKDRVLLRMQQFKRASPQKMGHKEKTLTRNNDNDCDPSVPPVQRQDTPESFSPGVDPEPQDSDEVLALRLQQELDREAAEVQTVDLEDRGLFFCHICHRDLSHMTPEGRTQHLNRCLDQSEQSAPAPPPLPPPPPPPPPPLGVPDCQICGKKFKSQKSRSAHLKRCSSEMGVPPAVLLQVLQRQAEETQNANKLTETGSIKRKASSKSDIPARKRPKNKTEPLDEDTMVALALSSSLLEQERESERPLQTEATAVLKWRPVAGKGRGKRKREAILRPPPLLLVQNAEAALAKLQERVSALLLCSRSPSPPTPTRCPSSLPGWSGFAPLWQKSTLMDGGPTCLSDFYTPELREFITPSGSSTTDSVSPYTINKHESTVQPTSEGTPVAGAKASILPASSQTVDSTPGSEQLPVGSQTLRDLMELAEDGMTLTQCGYTASGPDKEKSAGLISNLHLSGFVRDKSEEPADLCVSRVSPETTHNPSDDTHRQERKTDQPGAETEHWSNPSVALSKLASDLSSMVNNPQLCDVQLQVDSGEVYFAHSFMVYARCPLLAEMVHESGFEVREDGMPAAQRVLMNDVPGQAVFALLQYLYTARCSIPASLRSDVLELASRFDLQELQQLCKLRQDDAETRGDEESCMNQEENVKDQTDQAFMELLSSMWNEEDEDNEGTNAEEGSDDERALEKDCQANDIIAGDREICEEKVNEEELEEIYEFAATQRKKEEEENDNMEEKEYEEEVVEDEDGKEVFTKLTEPKRSSTGFSVENLQPNPLLEPDPSLDRSYSRLLSESWGVYEEGEPSPLPSTSGQPKMHIPESQKHQSTHKPPFKLSDKSLLHSSASAMDDLSLSLPPSTSNLPIAGLSPPQAAVDVDMSKEGLPLNRESQGPCSICAPLSPESLQTKTEPELIVLSDSSDEMDVILCPHSPSPHSPRTVEKLQSYTQIKPQPVLKHDKPTQENKKSSTVEFSPDDPSAARVQTCDQSAVECSPEVSWLIPSTPLQHGQSTTTSTTQTRSSMCRTQLFPKDDRCSPSPSVLSSPSPLKNRLQTCNSPTTHSSHMGPTEDCVPRFGLKEMVPRDFGFDQSFCPTRNNSCDVSNVREMTTVPTSQYKRSHLSSSTSSKQDTPLHIQPRPYSSTPLQTELHSSPAPLVTSPLDSNLEKHRWTSQGRDKAPSDSPERTELGSFRLSPLSDPSDPNCSSSRRGIQSSQRHSGSSRQSGRSVEFSSRNNTGAGPTRSGMTDEKGERDCKKRDAGDEGEKSEATEESRVTESSFRQSFMAMDDPPIAFNDSWGLDVCVDANLGCFSLRMEDSGGSNQQEHSPPQGETAKLSWSTGCQPSPPSHSVPLLDSRCCMVASSPAKVHRSQPSTSAQANADPSSTPSPPDPTARTTPEISNSLLDSKIWASWEEEEEEEETLPLSLRVNPSAQLKTPASSQKKRRRTLLPITPMPHYSDLDTPELKNKLNRFGVRPLPKRQMILKLKEIHQYTHQLESSDSDAEAPSAGRTAPMTPPPSSLVAAGNRTLSCTQKFKEPRKPAVTSPLKHNREEEAEQLSASQASHTSSNGDGEESERSNPELCLSSNEDLDSDIGISASQRVTCLQDRLRAVRSLILSDSELYTQILQYKPLVLSQLQERLKASGIRLGAAKLVDYLDSQCITFTTAKPGHSAPSRRRTKKTGKPAKTAGESGASRKRGVTAIH